MKTITSEFLITDDFRIHYTNSGVGEPLVLIHGGGTWLYSFRHNLPALSQRFSVYALDMPGHGYTVPLHENVQYDLETMNRALFTFMERKGIEKASLVGHSWGGGWAIYFTGRHSSMVKKLILIDSSGLNVHDTLEWQLLKYPIIGELISKYFTEASVRLELEKTFFDKDLVTQEMIQEIYIPLTFKENRKAQYLLERNLDWKLTEEAMPHIQNPTLVIWGANDAFLSPQLAKKFGDLIPNVTVKILEKCGHSAHVEHPDKVNRLITEFASPLFSFQ